MTETGVTEYGGRTFDRMPHWDDRNSTFMVADHFSVLKPARNRRWKRHLWLDQGREGACTGFSGAHMLGFAPKRVYFGINDFFARGLYYENRRNDEWPGEQYEGSSNLGLMRTLRNRGYTTNYYWAKTLVEMIHGVSHHGPLVIGVDWYLGMFNTDADGYIRATGSILGGHSVQVGGVNITDRFFWIDNSWGKDWGVNGSAKLTFTDMGMLLEDQGDAVLAKKKYKLAV